MISHVAKPCEKDDLAGTVTDVKEEVATLPQKHSELWDVFKTVKGSRDKEKYERLLEGLLTDLRRKADVRILDPLEEDGRPIAAASRTAHRPVDLSRRAV